MENFYSILKLSPNIATDDSVAIGVILFDGEKFRAYISDKKIKIANKLIGDHKPDINFIVDQIIEKCNSTQLNKDLQKPVDGFLDIFEISYFDYLNKYSNGLLQFSKPTILNEIVDEVVFEKLVNFLFKESLHEEETKEDDAKDFRILIHEKLIKKVEERVHTHYKFKPEVFNSIFFPFEIDCIGLNGSLIGAKSQSFSKTAQSLDKDLSHYVTLISSLTHRHKKLLKDNHFFLISEEPENIASKEHKLWDAIQKNELISVIHPEESNKVAELIIEKKAAKFLDEVS